MKHVVKYWRVPSIILSDCDPRFTWRFWTELFKKLALRDFKTNGLAKLLDVAQFSYSLQRNECTGKSPFEIVARQQPSTPSTVATSYKGSSPAAYKFAKSWQEEANLVWSCLNKVSRRMKKWTDNKRQHSEYELGDQVLVKLHNILRHKDSHRDLERKYKGPFRVLKRVGRWHTKWSSLRS